MGRLFTYMVKAAAGERLTGEDRARYLASVGLSEQQPIPTYDYFTPLGSKHPLWNTEDYRLPPFYQDGMGNRWNAVDNLYSSSADIDAWQALNAGGGNNWGTAYATAVNPAFTSPEAAARFLDEHPEYERELIRFAQFGGDPTYVNFRDGGPGTPSLKDISNSPFALNGGRGNVRLALNLVKAHRERAARQAAAPPSPDSDEDITASAAPAPAPQPDAVAPQPAAAPVQPPAIPEGTYVVTGPDDKKYISSNGDSKAQTAAGIGAALKAGRNPFAGALTTAPGASGPTRVNMNAAQDAVRNKVNSNISSGRSMYSNMGAAGRFMTEAQRHAMDAARPYEDSGLRMVGHSADGSTRTYVGKSGRGRITVGDNAQAGHYRGVGAVDTNTRSNYADLRQPNATRPVKPPTVPPVRPKFTTPRQ